MSKKALTGIAIVIVVILSLILFFILRPEWTRRVSGKIIIYTSVPLKITQEIEKEFEAKNPKIDLEILREGTNEIVKRINHEAEVGTLGSDIIWVADFSAAEELKEKGFFQQYVSREVKKIIPIFVDPEGYYTGSRLLNMVLVYNTDIIKEPLESYHDLLNPE